MPQDENLDDFTLSPIDIEAATSRVMRIIQNGDLISEIRFDPIVENLDSVDPMPVPDCSCSDCRWDQADREAREAGYAGVDPDSLARFVLCEGTSRCYSCQPPGCPRPESTWQPDFDDYPEEYESREDDYPDDDAAHEVEIPAVSVEDVPTKIRSTQESSLYLPVLPDRPIRLMSFEQEVARGADDICRTFYNHGHSPYEEVLSYGSSYEVSRRHRNGGTFAHVEWDSSCGGEVVYSRIDLSNDNMASRFESAVGEVRDMIGNGLVRLDMHCGFHNHADLGFNEMKGYSAFSMNAVENLYHTHNYLEDFFYRIGASKWSAHRTEINDTDYSQVTPKGYKGKIQIGMNIRRDRYALNLSNYLRARGNCECGAFTFAAWEECTCSLDKPTVEFRWPNATANPRKIHAFSSILQGLIARCSHAEAGEFAHLPAMEFTGTGHSPHPDDMYDRIAWIGQNIPQTKEERASLAYCVGSHFGPESDYMAEAIRNLPYERREVVAIG